MFSILKFIRSVIALRQVIYTEAMVSGHPVSSCLWAAFRESCQRSRISLKPCRGWRDPRFSINDIVLNNCQMNTIRCIPKKVKQTNPGGKGLQGDGEGCCETELQFPLKILLLFKNIQEKPSLYFFETTLLRLPLAAPVLLLRVRGF